MIQDGIVIVLQCNCIPVRYRQGGGSLEIIQRIMPIKKLVANRQKAQNGHRLKIRQMQPKPGKAIIESGFITTAPNLSGAALRIELKFKKSIFY